VSKKTLLQDEDKAVKILDLRDKEDTQKLNSRLVKDSHAEASMWLNAKNHKNIVQLHEVFRDARFCYFVMEKCASGLFQFMESLHEFNERSLGNVIAQMLHGVAHVHSIGIVHRDIKADNFLIGGEEGVTVKLNDFGLSAVVPSSGKLQGCVGTSPYMSPEMLNGNHYDMKTDVWSFAVLAYTLLFGAFPYTPKVKNSKAMREAIVQGKPPNFQPSRPYGGHMRSNSAVTFAHSLLKRNPAQRPNADEALNLPYIVAVSNNRHMLECELPSLRPMLYLAKREGAFEFRDLTKELDIDSLLDDMQNEKWGQRSLGKLHTIKTASSSVIGSKASTCSATASVEPWKNASSSVTTASGNTHTKSNSPQLSQTSLDSPRPPLAHRA